jgi:hypothetical protein
MVLCPRGIHYYDASKYEKCPYCERIESGRGGEPTAPGISGESSGMSRITTPVSGAPEAAPAKSRARRHVDSSPTAAWYPSEDESGRRDYYEPVVGWLVVVDGPEKGRDYRIVPGRNSIGRDPSAEVAIEGDELMSKEHAVLYYYAENNQFYLEDNRSKHGTFLMPEKALVAERRPVEDGNRIKVGKTTFILKTLCGKEFTWEKEE